MKKTEHVPSTGRPSKTVLIPTDPPPQNCPQNSSLYCRRLLHLSRPGTSALSSSQHKLPASLPPPRENPHITVWSSPYVPPPFLGLCPPSTSSSSCYTVVAPTSLQTLTHTYTQRAIRVSDERAAISTVDSTCRPCYFDLVHIEVLLLLSCLQHGVEYNMSNKSECFLFFFLLLLKVSIPDRRLRFLFDVHFFVDYYYFLFCF